MTDKPREIRFLVRCESVRAGYHEEYEDVDLTVVDTTPPMTLYNEYASVKAAGKVTFSGSGDGLAEGQEYVAEVRLIPREQYEGRELAEINRKIGDLQHKAERLRRVAAERGKP